MNDNLKHIKARMGQSQLAQELSKSKTACQRAGISRIQFFESKDPC